MSDDDPDLDEKIEERRRRNAPFHGLQVAALFIVAILLLLKMIEALAGTPITAEQKLLDRIRDAIVVLIAAILFCTGCIINELRRTRR